MDEAAGFNKHDKQSLALLVTASSAASCVSVKGNDKTTFNMCLTSLLQSYQLPIQDRYSKMIFGQVDFENRQRDFYRGMVKVKEQT